VNVRFCPSCRSLILRDFRFCPYCGAAAKGPSLGEALDAPFDRMAREAPGRGDVFASAEERLERLEADMDLILEALEKEGRPPAR
jgi:hypothetical protein